MNTLPVNSINPLWNKIRKAIENRFPGRLKPPAARRRRFEIQLEFPWDPKR
jgi:hypothetical protein